MVGGPIEFVPSYSLFYTNRGQKKMYELLGIRTQLEFAKFLGKPEGLSNDDLDKMVMAGLVWNHPEITLEEVQEIIEVKFYIEGDGDFELLNTLIIKAFVNAGILNKEKVELAQKIKDVTDAKMKQELENKLREVQEDDKGNQTT